MTDMRRRKFITFLGRAAVGFWLLIAARRTRAAGRNAFRRRPFAGFSSHQRTQHCRASTGITQSRVRRRSAISRSNIASRKEFPERLSSLATIELVALKPDVIVVGSTTAIVRASKITQTIPLVVIGATDDPVRLGLAESISHPGRNVREFMLETCRSGNSWQENSSCFGTLSPGSHASVLWVILAFSGRCRRSF